MSHKLLTGFLLTVTVLSAMLVSVLILTKATLVRDRVFTK